MMTYGRRQVIFQNSFRRVVLSVRAEAAILRNRAVLSQRCSGHWLLARVISTKWRRVFAVRDFQTLTFARPTERSLGINPLWDLHQLRTVFLQEFTRPLITPRLR